eukprot:TRINITY_DN981_c0_g1_i1.p1 TRINITY_DN981_c0_g1~~TRINITY_DN981_c0_g1_i1.p1  ORF type:complete len:282 (-),score=69.79 TRINITY_DN981_c0_g1_i1:106-951(-)
MSSKVVDNKRKDAPAKRAAPVKAAAKPQAKGSDGPQKKKLKIWKRKPISVAAVKKEKVEKKADKMRTEKKKFYVKKIAKPTAFLKPTKKGKKVLVVRPRLPRIYPIPVQHQKIQKKKGTPKLRKSITPGTVLILLGGRFKGRRVVFLKQLKSGLLLITGPFKINGVPLRRVHQKFVIATSTKIDISGVEVPKKVTDKYLSHRNPPTKQQKLVKHFFTTRQLHRLGRRTPKALLVLKKGIVKYQKAVDTPILAKIKGVPSLRKYLSSNFNLKKGQYPHEIKF